MPTFADTWNTHPPPGISLSPYPRTITVSGIYDEREEVVEDEYGDQEMDDDDLWAREAAVVVHGVQDARRVWGQIGGEGRDEERERVWGEAMDIDFQPPSGLHTPLLILDTNILLSSLPSLVTLARALTPLSSPSPVLELIVPGIVVHELDTQTKHNPKLGPQARKATDWVLGELRRRKGGGGGCVRVQREGDTRGGGANWKWSHMVNDDLILDCCLFFSGTTQPVFLLTDDKNLSLKAESHDIPAIPGFRLRSTKKFLLDLIPSLPDSVFSTSDHSIHATDQNRPSTNGKPSYWAANRSVSNTSTTSDPGFHSTPHQQAWSPPPPTALSLQQPQIQHAWSAPPPAHTPTNGLSSQQYVPAWHSPPIPQPQHQPSSATHHHHISDTMDIDFSPPPSPSPYPVPPYPSAPAVPSPAPAFEPLTQAQQLKHLKTAFLTHIGPSLAQHVFTLYQQHSESNQRQLAESRISLSSSIHARRDEKPPPKLPRLPCLPSTPPDQWTPYTSLTLLSSLPLSHPLPSSSRIDSSCLLAFFAQEGEPGYRATGGGRGDWVRVGRMLRVVGRAYGIKEWVGDGEDGGLLGVVGVVGVLEEEMERVFGVRSG